MKDDHQLFVGEVIAMGDRQLRISGMPDGVTLCRDHRMRIAVRNLATDRLSYIPEWRLLKARRDQCQEDAAEREADGDPCACLHDGRGALVSECQEHREIREQRDELLAALKTYVDWFGGAHIDGCPADDTCFCSGPNINDAVNRAIARAEGK